MNTHTTAEELVEAANFKPSFSDETMKEIEQVASGNNVGLIRRYALVACARSADDLSKVSMEQPEAYTEMMEGIETFKDHAKGLLDVAEAASVRIKIADCRENNN